MGLDEDLRKSLKEFNKPETQVFTATVTKINEAKKTVDVVDVDGLDFFDVRLSAAEDDTKSVLLIPKVGSSVLVAMIGNTVNALFVAMTNEVEKITGEIDDTKFKIDRSGYQVIKGSQNLKVVLNDLIDEVNKIIVVNGTSINVAAMNAIKQRLNTILIE